MSQSLEVGQHIFITTFPKDISSEFFASILEVEIVGFSKSYLFVEIDGNSKVFYKTELDERIYSEKALLYSQPNYSMCSTSLEIAEARIEDIWLLLQEKHKETLMEVQNALVEFDLPIEERLATRKVDLDTLMVNLQEGLSIVESDPINFSNVGVELTFSLQNFSLEFKLRPLVVDLMAQSEITNADGTVEFQSNYAASSFRDKYVQIRSLFHFNANPKNEVIIDRPYNPFSFDYKKVFMVNEVNRQLFLSELDSVLQERIPVLRECLSNLQNKINTMSLGFSIGFVDYNLK